MAETEWTNATMPQLVAAGHIPSDQDLTNLLESSWQEWSSQPDSRLDLVEWACSMFGSSLQDITRETLKAAVTARVAQFVSLYKHIMSSAELSQDHCNGVRLQRIGVIIRECRNMVQQAAVLHTHLDDEKELVSGTGSTSKWSPETFFMFGEEDMKATSFQKIVMYVLQKLEADQLRRFGDKCYEQVVIRRGDCQGEASHAWRECMSIKDYIYSNVQKETDYTEWKQLTNPHDNGDKVVQYLISSQNLEFPELQVNRYLWAYNNGLYNAMTDTFWPFKSRRIRRLQDVTHSRVSQLSKHTCSPDDEQMHVAESILCDGVHVWNIDGEQLTLHTVFMIGTTYYTNETGPDDWSHLAADITAFRRGLRFLAVQDVDQNGVQALVPLAPSQTNTPTGDAKLVNGVSVWHVGDDDALFPHTVFGVDGLLYSNDNGYEVWKSVQAGEAQYTAHEPTDTDVAVKYFDQDFRYDITPATEAVFDPRTIELPELDTIMSTQKLEADTREWLVLMLCRLFFPVGFDKWQVVLFIKGSAGTGKSTIAQIVRSFYPKAYVTTLSSNIEKGFGLSGVYKGLICICSEVRENFGLDQGDWQATVSGEEVQIAEKHKTAFSIKWETPFLFLGNELPKYRNNSGSVDRRILMIDFAFKPLVGDPNMLDKFQTNVDHFQRKGISLYHAALRKHHGKDIWAADVVSQQIVAWRDEVKGETDCLYQYLTTPGLFELAPQNYMPFKKFKEMYAEWRKDNGHLPCAFNKSHYAAVFHEGSIFTQHGPNTFMYEGSQQSQHAWLRGIDTANQ